MPVTTKVHTSVEVRVYARSTVWVANELMRVLQEVVHQRGLPLDYLHHNHQTIISGLRTWITSRWLLAAILEIWDPHTGLMIERYDLGLSYQPPGQGGEERFETDIEKLKAALARIPQLHPGSNYQVVVQLEPGAPNLPGWAPTTLRDASHLQRQEIGNIIDTARIGVQMAYWSGQPQGGERTCA